jgi:hypothetical protein
LKVKEDKDAVLSDLTAKRSGWEAKYYYSTMVSHDSSMVKGEGEG